MDKKKIYFGNYKKKTTTKNQKQNQKQKQNKTTRDHITKTMSVSNQYDTNIFRLLKE